MSSEKPLENLQSLFKELYHPGFKPEDIDFSHFYDVAEKEAKEDIDRTYATMRSLNGDSPRNTGSLAGDAAIKRPITKEESLLIDAKKEQVYQRAIGLRKDIESEISKIDDETLDWSQTFDLKSRPRLRKAIKRIFGEKKETISYAEFKSLLIRKKQLEMTEAADMMRQDNDNEDTTKDQSGLDFIKDIMNTEVN